jgi:predicted nucleic acid-binding protein
VKDRVLVDTGPLVAILSLHDDHHAVCLEQLRRLSTPLLTTWPVLTEVAWLLRGELTGIQRLLASFNHGFLRLLDFGEEAMPWLSEFLFRYKNLNAQLADASLVYLAERESIDTVFTLDRRDFALYRLSGNRPLRIWPETSD